MNRIISLVSSLFTSILLHLSANHFLNHSTRSPSSFPLSSLPLPIPLLLSPFFLPLSFPIPPAPSPLLLPLLPLYPSESFLLPFVASSPFLALQ